MEEIRNRFEIKRWGTQTYLLNKRGKQEEVLNLEMASAR